MFGNINKKKKKKTLEFLISVLELLSTEPGANTVRWPPQQGSSHRCHVTAGSAFYPSTSFLIAPNWIPQQPLPGVHQENTCICFMRQKQHWEPLSIFQKGLFLVCVLSPSALRFCSDTRTSSGARGRQPLQIGTKESLPALITDLVSWQQGGEGVLAECANSPIYAAFSFSASCTFTKANWHFSK